MLGFLEPKPFRGDVVAAGVTVLVIATGLMELRVSDTLDAGVRAAVLTVLWAFVLTLAVRSPVEQAEPRAYQSVLYVEALIFALLALAAWAATFGDRGWLADDGTRVWVIALMTLHAAILGRVRNSPVCTLLAAVGFSGSIAFGVVWLTDDSRLGVVRWLLLAVGLAYAVNAVRLYTRRPRHSVAFAEAAGLTFVGLAVTWSGVLFPLPDGGAFPVAGIDAASSEPAVGWTLVLLLAGFSLVGYGGVERERGPIWIGALLLLHFSILELDGGLWAWPILLFALAGALLVAGLRPTTPAPPEPGSDVQAPEPVPFSRHP